MTTKKLLKVFALTVGLAAGSGAYAAGDIYEFRPCTATGETIQKPEWSASNPLTSGEKVYFNMRLVNRGTGYKTTWSLKHIGSDSEVVDDAMNPLKIGLFVSGQIKWATYEFYRENGQFTDFVFSYTTEVGDFAMPIVLALKNGQPADEKMVQSAEFLFLNDNIWKITNVNSDKCNFAINTDASPTSPETGSPISNYSLSKCNFFVRTVDFDSNWESAEAGHELWRSVHESSSVCVGGTPKLEAIATLKEAVTLYVWSDDDSIIRVKGGESKDVGKGAMRQVGKVVLSGGRISADFAIEGMAGKNGKSTVLYLSQFDHYRYDNGGTRVVDYLKVPVACVEPLPQTILVDPVEKVVYASGEYKAYPAQVNVNITSPYENDIEVTITPSFEKTGTSANIADYVRLSLVKNDSVLPEETSVTFKLPKNSTVKTPVYVYCLRADELTYGSSLIRFSATVNSPADAKKIQVTNGGFEIRPTAADLKMASPLKHPENRDACAGEDVPITLSVSDSYADMNDEKGYEIYYRYQESNIDFEKLPGVYRPREDGALYLVEDGKVTGKKPVVNYRVSGVVTSSVYVVSPVNGNQSKILNVEANINPARHVTVLTYADDDPENVKTEFDEGDTIAVKLQLSEKFDCKNPYSEKNEVYAYFRPTIDVDPSVFNCPGGPNYIIGMPNLEGIRVPVDSLTADARLKLLDGTQTGLGYSFDVIFSFDRYWSGKPEELRAPPRTFITDPFRINVRNVEAKLKKVRFNGFLEKEPKAGEEGYTFPGQYPLGRIQTLEVTVDEPGTYDLTTTKAGEEFEVSWQLMCNDLPVTSIVTKGDPRVNKLEYDFPRAGLWRIEVAVKDKDTDEFPDEPHVVFVRTLKNPTLVLEGPKTIIPENKPEEAMIKLDLGYVDEAYDGDITVKLTVVLPETDDGNSGRFVLPDQYRSKEPGEENIYYVNLNQAVSSVDIYPKELDGTAATRGGLSIMAEVVNDDILPQSGKPANEYYLGTTLLVRIDNVAPTWASNTTDVFADPHANNNSNRWEVAGGDPGRTITWGVGEEVKGDFDGIASFPGVKVTITGCDNAPDPTYYKSLNEAQGTFAPVFSTTGERELTITVEDKDHGLISYTWYYKVTPSKFLYTVPNGPSGGIATSPLSRMFLGQKGLGEGHIYPASGSLISFSDFRGKFNCGKVSSLDLYGWGYKVGAVDDGTLNNNRDYAIDASGNYESGKTITEYYRYPEENLDSYLYAWLIHTPAENGMMNTSLAGETIAPEFPGKIDSGKGNSFTVISLPNGNTDDGGYLDTYLEGLFAKEWRAADNLGDMNQDGIPDYYLVQYPDAAGDVTSTANVSGANPDADFLPTGATAGNSIVPGAMSGWETKGVPFSFKLELRGFGDGLNAGFLNADGTLPAPDFTDDELLARQEWYDEQVEAGTIDTEKFPSADSLTIQEWSPERPTDPTVADTDGDGFEDGFEYWFWYGAKVGYRKNGEWQGRMKGRKLNLDNVFEFEPITPADICAAFDPLTAGVAAQKRDTDNDGLLDTEEILIGTNPVDCDTDGDHIPDGWEVMNGLNPLDSNDSKGDAAQRNPDHDFMALHKLAAELVYAVDTDMDGEPDEFYIRKDENDKRETPLWGWKLGKLVVWGLYSDKDPIPVRALGPLMPVDGQPENFDETKTLVDCYEKEVDFALIHSQVYDYCEYDPRTGWFVEEHGYVHPRWWNDDQNPRGLAEDTVPFNSLDEFLSFNWRGGSSATDGDTTLDKLRSLTTMPNNPYERSYGDGSATYASSNYGVDTDSDGMPDGWELYVKLNPNDSRDAGTDLDDDHLTQAMEFACTDAADNYKDVPSIADKAPGPASGWWNKFFPTDPHNNDTDGDGIVDGREGGTRSKAGIWSGNTLYAHDITFNYGDYTDNGSTCIRGGGMNPTTIDTDTDGLPDPWEWQFGGFVVQPGESGGGGLYSTDLMRGDGFFDGVNTAKGAFISGGMDATWGGDAALNALDLSPNVKDDVTGTMRDVDWDRDGLTNVEEYRTQLFRHWRYDDAVTPLMGRTVMGDVVGPQVFDPENAGDAPGYYVDVPHAKWDCMAARPIAQPRGFGANPSEISVPYGTTDPRRWDSDGDGMDDFWEIYHGLNPLLGGMVEVGTELQPARDSQGKIIMDDEGNVVSNEVYVLASMGSGEDLLSFYTTELAYGPVSGYSATVNPWTTGKLLADGTTVYDPFLTPWTMGLPNVDADGDGIRNDEEAIKGNFTSPRPMHTDPSPRWFTDVSSPLSYTAQYYTLVPMHSSGFVYEQNEGYDTDGDFRGDAHESVKAVQMMTDPLEANDPDHRAALYLPGQDALAYMYSDVMTEVPQTCFDRFRQFTVECWVKPESGASGAQTIVERGYAYGQSTATKTNVFFRANFRLGLDEQGCLYGMFDNSDCVPSGSGEIFSCQTVRGSELPKDEWSHVALAFDGKKLCLYLNGNQVASAKTGLIPANGVLVVTQDPVFKPESYQEEIDLQYPSLTCMGLPGGLAVGARRTQAIYDPQGDFTQFTDYFKGYVSELRVWHGARDVSDIKADLNKRYTQEDFARNRADCFAKYLPMIDSDDNNQDDMMPPQVLMIYNFQQIPSAVNAADVAKVPSGFNQGVLDNAKSCPSGFEDMLNVGWWYGMETLHSTVYDDYHVVPFLQNLVQHAQPFNNMMWDSRIWSNPYFGYVPASETANNSFKIPNTANPYWQLNYFMPDSSTMLHRWQNILNGMGDDEMQIKFTFEGEYYSWAGFPTDLLPLGGAYIKRDTDFWDGQGATSAWKDLGVDADGDDLPDWWEALYGDADSINPNTIVDWNGRQMTAAEAYVRDLARGMMPDGSVDEAYADREDKNKDGLPDWWADLYGLETTGSEDEDGDGLSNFSEFLMSEVFDLGEFFSPVNPHSVSAYDNDYFFRIGNLYAGEIFTDHDFMEDVWENGYPSSYVSRYIWDAASDNDEDGWSAWAENRYNDYTSRIQADGISHMVEDAEMRDFPTPTMKVLVRYNGAQPVVTSQTKEGSSSSSSRSGSSSGSGDTESAATGNELAPLVIKTYTHKDTQADNLVADATYNVQPGAMAEHQLYLGLWSDRTVHGVMNPGYLIQGTITMQTAPLNQADIYMWYLTNPLTGEQMGPYKSNYEEYMEIYAMYGGLVRLAYANYVWEDDYTKLLAVTRVGETSKGYFTINGERVGNIDVETGAFDINLKQLENWYGVSMASNGAHAMACSVVRLKYQSQTPVLAKNKMQLYLGSPDQGYVREGENTIEAFYDLDANGAYTPGEPYGIVRGVDVGWSQGVCEIELTDTNPMITRCDITTGTTDRRDGYGNDDKDIGEEGMIRVGELSGGKYQQVRVIRTLINGVGINHLNVNNTVVVNKWLNLAQRSYISEADIIDMGELDLDWSNFYRDVMLNNGVINSEIDPTEVAYRIVLGNGTAEVNTTNNLFSVVTVRHFDSSSLRMAPVTIAPGRENSVIYGARPVFKWTMNGNNSYTAFQIDVMQGGSVVWSSGVLRAPATDINGVYTYVPDVFAGDALEVGQSYTWRVQMYNAKFSPDYSARSPAWSDAGSFQVATVTNGTEYGSIRVAVKYHGPSMILDAGTVRVEAYESPDFSGSPVARTYVRAADLPSVSAVDAPLQVNATLIGIPAGRYFVRAWIDFDRMPCGAYVKDDWESWGYVCPRERQPKEMFTPTVIEVGPECGIGEVFPCWIEDVDTNANCIPDAYEIVKYGSLKSSGTKTEMLDYGITIDQTLADNLQKQANAASATAGLAAMALRSISMPELVELIVETVSEGLVKADNSIKAVKLDSFSLTSEGGVSMDVVVETADQAVTAGEMIYKQNQKSATLSRTYTLKILGTSDLKSGDWKVLGQTSITVNTKGRSTFTAPELTGDAEACHFFKAVLEEK